MPRTNDWTPQSRAVLYGHAEDRQTEEQRDRLATCFNLIKKNKQTESFKAERAPHPNAFDNSCCSQELTTSLVTCIGFAQDCAGQCRHGSGGAPEV